MGAGALRGQACFPSRFTFRSSSREKNARPAVEWNVLLASQVGVFSSSTSPPASLPVGCVHKGGVVRSPATGACGPFSTDLCFRLMYFDAPLFGVWGCYVFVEN